MNVASMTKVGLVALYRFVMSLLHGWNGVLISVRYKHLMEQ